MVSTHTAYRISSIAGLLVLSLAVLSATLEPVPVCGTLTPGYTSIIAFEMARSVDDLHAIFGDTPNECRSAIAAQMDLTNWIDVFMYIPVYGSFLVFFFLGMGANGSRVASIAVRMIVIACVADYAENACLFQLSANPDVASGWLSLLPWVTEIKWVGLGIAATLGGYLLAGRGGAWQLLWIPCSLGAIAALASIFSPALAGPYLSLAFAPGWIALLAVAIRESLRRRASVSAD